MAMGGIVTDWGMLDKVTIIGKLEEDDELC